MQQLKKKKVMIYVNSIREKVEKRKSDYKLSNEVVTINRNRFAKKYIKELVKCESALERAKCSQELITYLCDIFNICDVKVIVKNVSRPKKGKVQVYGYYQYCDNGNIVIYNLTATQKKIVGAKSFIDTLIHEFVHHYDRCKLGIEYEYHTLGFYKRVNDLRIKLS